MTLSNESCCVFKCSSVRRKNPSVMFHSFPQEGQRIKVVDEFGTIQFTDRRKLWIVRLRIKKTVSKCMKVCSLHFQESDYECSGWSSRKRLISTAVPSQNLPVRTHDRSEDEKRRKNAKHVRKDKHPAKTPGTSSSEESNAEPPLQTTSMFSLEVRKPISEQSSSLKTTGNFLSEVMEPKLDQPLPMLAVFLSEEYSFSDCSTIFDFSMNSEYPTGNKSEILDTVCRVCLKRVQNKNYFLLSEEDAVSKSLNLIRMLTDCMPNIDLSITTNPIICKTCTTSLTSMQSFMTQSNLCQEFIKGYMVEHDVDKICALDEVAQVKMKLDEVINDCNQQSKNPEQNEEISVEQIVKPEIKIEHECDSESITNHQIKIVQDNSESFTNLKRKIENNDNSESIAGGEATGHHYRLIDEHNMDLQTNKQYMEIEPVDVKIDSLNRDHHSTITFKRFLQSKCLKPISVRVVSITKK